MTNEQHHEPTAMELELARLRQENATLRAAQSKTGRIKVSDKGGVSVYGLGRFPVTLYMSQWEKLDALMPEVKKFIVENAALLAQKEA